MFRTVVLLSGRGSNFKALHESLSGDKNVSIVGVISDREKAGGVEYARLNAIPCSVVERRQAERSQEDFWEEIRSKLADLVPDLVILTGFMRLMPASLIKHYKGRLINIHPSLLPSFRGLKAQKQALDAGVKYAGCTVHHVVEECDAGEIIAQAVVPVYANDTEETLAARILSEEHKLLPKVVKLLSKNEFIRENGRLVTADEHRSGGSLASL